MTNYHYLCTTKEPAHHHRVLDRLSFTTASCSCTRAKRFDENLVSVNIPLFLHTHPSNSDPSRPRKAAVQHLRFGATHTWFWWACTRSACFRFSNYCNDQTNISLIVSGFLTVYSTVHTKRHCIYCTTAWMSLPIRSPCNRHV